MNPIEGLLLWGAILLYVASLVASFGGAFLRWDKWGAFALRLWPFALALHLAAGLARWIATGHAPVMYAYENSLAGSFVVGLIFWWVMRRFPAATAALPLALAAVLLLLGNGLMAPRHLTPLEPPFRSGWLAVHVLFAWIAFGSFLTAAVLGGLYLRDERRARRGEPNRAPLFDDLTGRLVALGFAGDTVMIASGAIWAHGLWGRYWAWDPIETWSLVTWLVYGAHLHLRFTLGWKERRAAWLAVGSFVTVIITFFGIGVVSDVHTQLLGK